MNNQLQRTNKRVTKKATETAVRLAENNGIEKSGRRIDGINKETLMPLS